MNIDKFGHHVHKRLRLSEYLDNFNDTLVKSESGDFNLKSSRLRGLLLPESEDEAVNKEYVDLQIENLQKYMKKLNSDIIVYLQQLEKATLSSFYTKEEVDKLIESKVTEK